MTNMTNMHDMTNMSNILNMQIPFAYAHLLLEYTHTPFYITNITNMQEICNKYTHPIFIFQKISNMKKKLKNAEYDNHPPGLTAAVRPGVGTKKYDKYAKYAEYAE